MSYKLWCGNRLTAFSLLIVAILSATARAEEEKPEKVEPIRDNSFLVEEAFNQDPGVVQNIFNWIPSWERDKGHRNDFQFLYTQEWPLFSQKHQISYSLPMLYTYEESPDGSPHQAQGFGDALLNYRYQLLEGKDGGWWIAPRFSLIFPTGDEKNGLGKGQLGYQINLPFSREFEKCAIHFNAGTTYTPGVSAGIDPDLGPVLGQNLHGYNLGASGIYFLKPHFNLMLESIALWDENNNADGTRDRTFQLILSPGVRWSPYTEGDTQWVVGVGVPIGLTRDAPDISLFLYMSFENRFMKKKAE